MIRVALLEHGGSSFSTVHPTYGLSRTRRPQPSSTWMIYSFVPTDTIFAGSLFSAVQSQPLIFCGIPIVISIKDSWRSENKTTFVQSVMHYATSLTNLEFFLFQDCETAEYVSYYYVAQWTLKGGNGADSSADHRPLY